MMIKEEITIKREKMTHLKILIKITKNFTDNLIQK